MAVHKGIRTYSGDEIGNLAIGQGGFDLLTNDTFAASDKGINYWVALKVVGGSSALQADNHADYPGDHFSTTGAAGGSAITVEDGDMIYGAFITVVVPSAKYIVAYRG